MRWIKGSANLTKSAQRRPFPELSVYGFGKFKRISLKEKKTLYVTPTGSAANMATRAECHVISKVEFCTELLLKIQGM